MNSTPPSRYGPAAAARPRRRLAIGLGVLVAVGAAAVATVAYQRYGSVDAEGELAAFEVLDDRTVSVTISVTRKDPSRPAVCIVRALAEDRSETGRREVLVAPADAATVQVSTTVITYRPSVAGVIYGCGLDVPGYLTAA